MTPCLLWEGGTRQPEHNLYSQPWAARHALRRLCVARGLVTARLTHDAVLLSNEA